VKSGLIQWVVEVVLFFCILSEDQIVGGYTRVCMCATKLPNTDVPMVVQIEMHEE